MFFKVDNVRFVFVIPFNIYFFVAFGPSVAIVPILIVVSPVVIV